MVSLSTPLRLLRRDALHALRFVRGWFVKYRSIVVPAVLAALVCIYLLAPLDARVISTVEKMNAAHSELKSWARSISYFGDFLGFNMLLFFGLQAAGWLMRSRRLLRVAVASLLCAMLAGASANVIRFLAGRPRPCVGLEDRLYGPSFSGNFQSLPSAHTATAFGGAVCVLLTQPVTGTPLTAMAVAVGWSRIQLNRHHLTDVLMSAAIAFLFSLPLSRWVAGRCIQRQRAASTRPSAIHGVAPSRLP